MARLLYATIEILDINMNRARRTSYFVFFSFLALVTMSGNVIAEWEMVGGENGTARYFADPTTTRKKAVKAKMWTLFALPTPEVLGNRKPFLSVMSQHEFDCNEEQVRILYMTFHSADMGRGEIVETIESPDAAWSPVRPNSVNNSNMQVACRSQ
jgi:hypothetical protein